MSVRRLTVVFVALLALLVASALPVAAGKPAPMGDQIDLINGVPTAFDAGEPFHIQHGWFFPREEASSLVPRGRFGFALTVDGTARPADFRTVTGGPVGTKRMWVHNFPAGLPAGDHSFDGWWLTPCQYAVDWGFYPGPCASPTEMVPAIEFSLTVTFS